MLLLILICVVNLAIGFLLALHFGHGPPWTNYPRLDRLRRKLRALLRMDGKPHAK